MVAGLQGKRAAAGGRWRLVGLLLARPVGWGSDRGSGVVWVVGFMAVVWVVAVTAMTVGSVRAARHRADAAADLAALAGAARVAEGRAAACRAAEAIAAKSGGRLSACGVRGRVVEISVTVVLKVPIATDALRVSSRARAGPVGTEGVF
ncbi:Rv3654c family TadE-like protein [Actinomadura sp. 6N118]|uniref:Rv3654c family TadE-like protein n=1 Tax=Actinomadura sp. 6N118 TaxID=3375151 RepID=UPI00378E0A51